jgi:hypothetical protein
MNGIPPEPTMESAMMTITAICREDGYLENILIYTVKVVDPHNYAEVQAAVQAERAHDVDDANEMDVMFVFQGDLAPLADWRN